MHQIELEIQNEELRHARLELELSHEKYFDLYHMAPVGYLTVNDEGMIEDANLAAALLVGVERQALVERLLSSFILAPDQDVWHRLRTLLRRTGEPQTCELRMRRTSHEERAGGAPETTPAPDHFWAQLTVKPQDHGSGQAMSFRAAFCDITERVTAQEALRLSEQERRDALQVFDRVFHGAPLPMAMHRLPENDFTEVNDAFLNTLGYSRSEVLGKTAEALRLFVEPDKCHSVADDLESGGHIIDRELRVRCRDGAIRDGLFSGEIIESQGQRYALTVMVDRTERKLAEEQVHEQHEDLLRLNEELAARAAALEAANATITRIAATDDLTGLANRRHFYETLEKAISLARRHGSPVAFVSLDLDGLKEVNDSAGHQAGDEVLRSFAALLGSLCRSEDLAARLGGDEFGLLLPGIDLAGAHGLAERVLAAVRACAALAQNGVTASAGVAQWTPDELPDDLLRRTDEALYAAKRDGGDVVAGGG